MKKSGRKGSHPLTHKLSATLIPVFPRSQSTVALYQKGATPLRQNKEGKKSEVKGELVKEKKAVTLGDRVRGLTRVQSMKWKGKGMITDLQGKHRLSVDEELHRKPSAEKLIAKASAPKFPLPQKLRARSPNHKSAKELLNYLRTHSTSDLQSADHSFASVATPIRRRAPSRTENRAKSRLNHTVDAGEMVALVPDAPKVVRKAAFRTQTGVVGGQQKKHNQDSLLICQDFAGVSNQWLLGVFDGHGTSGHDVSSYIKRSLPGRLQPHLPRSSSPLSNSEIRSVCGALIASFLEVNHQLRINELIESDLSGSTAVLVLAREGLLLCANVGDSRAIAGRVKKNDMWVAVPLSKDHKPDDPVERARIERAGGRVEPFQGALHTDTDGSYVGPVRVWAQFEPLPGLAMSRSMGDFVAEEIGVIAEPEIVRLDLDREDRFVVVASDGVWEFISSQTVIGN